MGAHMKMNPKIEAVLQAYESRQEAENKLFRELPPVQIHARRDEFLLSLGPATGTLINVLVKEAQARRILEVGTAYGYSAIWLAEAAGAIGGKVTTLELSQTKSDYARAQSQQAGLASHVDFKVGDAFEILAALPGPFDFVLVDLWHEANVRVIDLVYPKLAPGAFIVGDNMLQPEVARSSAQLYRDHIRSKKDITTVLLPIGSGIELSRYK